MSSLFDPLSGDEATGKQFGERDDRTGRYHMPLLPGEQGTKAGGDWVPYGIMSATNLAGSIIDRRALNVWEIERVMIGLGRSPELIERMVFLIERADDDRDINLRKLRKTPGGVQLVADLGEVAEAAKQAAGANRASAMGTNRHDTWEARAATGQLYGTAEVKRQALALEALLEREGLERVPGLQERTVRNVGLQMTGRFDDVLMSRRTGQLFMADVKTKQGDFYSWMESWIQLAGYATAEWMLNDARTGYVAGPRDYVSQECAILLHAPSDGAPPSLVPVDVQAGYRWAELARDVCAARAEAKSVKTVARALWRDEA